MTRPATLGRVVDWRVEVPAAPSAWRMQRKLANAAQVAGALARPAVPESAAVAVDPYAKVFVVGCGRSGTSWVQDVIAASPHVATTQESHAYDGLYAPLVRAGSVRRPEGWLKVLQRFDVSWREQRWVGVYWWVTRPQLVAIMREVVGSGRPVDAAASLAVRRVLDTWFAAHRGQADVLLEKTPGHVAFADRILDEFPEARVVEVVRDARDVCVSLEKQALTLSWPPTERRDQIRLWRRAVERGQRLHDDPRWAGRVHRVRYEDLHADTAEQVLRLYRFLDLPIDDSAVADVVDATSITRFGDRADGRHRRKGAVGEWQSVLDADDLAIIESEAGELLRSVGYR